jgi:hypothetical protein
MILNRPTPESTTNRNCSEQNLVVWLSGGPVSVCVWSSGRLVVWSSCLSVRVWSSGRLVHLCASGRLVVWSSCPPMRVWSSGRLGVLSSYARLVVWVIWSSGCLVWLSAQLLSGRLVVWGACALSSKSGCLVVWGPCALIWLSGCLVVWGPCALSSKSGCLVVWFSTKVWLSGCLVVSLPRMGRCAPTLHILAKQTIRTQEIFSHAIRNDCEYTHIQIYLETM